MLNLLKENEIPKFDMNMFLPTNKTSSPQHVASQKVQPLPTSHLLSPGILNDPHVRNSSHQPLSQLRVASQLQNARILRSVKERKLLLMQLQTLDQPV